MTTEASDLDIGLVRRGYSATGGAEAYLLRLASGLRSRGCKVTLYTTADWPSDRWAFGDLVRLNATEPLEFARAFQQERKPGQVVLSLDRVPGCDVFRAGDGVHAAWLQRRSQFESAWKSRLRIFNLKHPALLALERQVFASARLVIANSKMVADEIVHWHNFPESKIRIVPNGIGEAIPRISRAEARRRLEIPEDAFCALFVGTGWERKGLRFAIEAVEMVGGDTLLLVAGRGNTKQFRSATGQILGCGPGPARPLHRGRRLHITDDLRSFFQCLPGGHCRRSPCGHDERQRILRDCHARECMDTLSIPAMSAGWRRHLSFGEPETPPRLRLIACCWPRTIRLIAMSRRPFESFVRQSVRDAARAVLRLLA